MPRTLPLLTLVVLLSCIHIDAYGQKGARAGAFAGRAEDPEAEGGKKESGGYELVPLYDTLWRRARAGYKDTSGEVADYGAPSFEAAGAGRPSRRTKRMGRLGASFLGAFGARNAARPPWGWFDRAERAARPGAWFFDPAATLKRHYRLGDEFSTAYLHAPFIGIMRR
jgi:hypothetical protein